MSARAYRFEVPGTPIPQGSKSAFLVGGRPVVVEQGRARLKPWRAQVADACAQAMNGAGLIVGPVVLRVTLYFPRPKSHHVADDPGRELKASAPTFVASRPDVEKVVRAVADALSGVAYRDDAQIATLHAVKLYGDPPRAVIEVGEVVYALRPVGVGEAARV